MAVTIPRLQILKSQSVSTKAPLRPIITSINGDVSWLISFPRPTLDRSTNGKVYYHAVVDPWFGKPSIFVHPYVMEMTLRRDPALSSRTDIDAAIVEIESAAGNTLIPTDLAPAIDGIFITSIVEHCHQESLQQFSASTPVFAVEKAANTISPWGHFNSVVTLASCDPSKTPWEEGHPGSPLPPWLTAFPPAVTRLNNFGLVLITSVNDSKPEMILFAPHGMGADEKAIKEISKTVEMLALVAPLKDSYTLGIQAGLGVKDGIAIAQYAGTKYYVRSGDVSLKYKGVLGWTVNDIPHDLQWGIDELHKEIGPEKEMKIPTLVNVENGGSYVLV